uniref:Peroxisomal membrane protein 11C n=1 Tax=Plectus sambesii TaxID=2011161 RepID=A0A914V831_9BILA
MSVSTEASLAKLFRLLDGSVGVLMQHNGRDKAMSAVYYSLLFCAGRINCANTTDKLMTLAKQFSSARIILRRFNDLPLIGANFIHFIHPPSDENDRICYDLQTAINVLYTIYSPIEHVAWLSDLKLLPFNASKWSKYSLFVWTSSLILSIVRSALLLLRMQVESKTFEEEDARKRLADKKKEELLNILSFSLDFLNAVNFLPYKGFFWAQSFPLWTTGLFGFLASCINLIKLYRAVK